MAPLFIGDDEPIPLSAAREICPPLRGEKPPSVATIYGWSKHGCKGVKLETVQLGGVRATTRAALRRFFAELTEATAKATGARPMQPIGAGA